MRKNLLVNFTIVFSTIFVFFLSLEMLSSGITSVFPHFYYLPILVGAYYYPRRGVLFSCAIGAIYAIPVLIFFPSDPITIFSAFIRIFMFILVAWIVSELVLRSNSEREENKKLLEFQNKIIENPNVMVIASDTEGEVVIWNRAAETTTGYSRDDILDTNEILDILDSSPEDKEKIRASISDLKQNPGILEEILIPCRTKGGERLYLLASLQTLKGNTDDIVGILGIAVDVTEKINLEIEKDKALAQIEKNISQMYILNDEIRNPLAVILGQAEIGNCPTRDIISEQVNCINDIITQLDKDSVESTKILEYLRKHYDLFNGHNF